MALRAQRNGMTAGEREAKCAVIEIVPEGILPIVTIQAGHPEGDTMIEHKGFICLLMTIAADGQIKCGDVIPVAIAAQERFALRPELVTV